MTIESEIRDGDDVLSRARVVAVFFDPEHPAARATVRTRCARRCWPRCPDRRRRVYSRVLTMTARRR